MTDFKSDAGDALDRAIWAERIKAVAKMPEVWVLAASATYLIGHAVYWWRWGFPVLGR